MAKHVHIARVFRDANGINVSYNVGDYPVDENPTRTLTFPSLVALRDRLREAEAEIEELLVLMRIARYLRTDTTLATPANLTAKGMIVDLTAIADQITVI